MKSIFMVITDSGDGSNSIEWHKTMSEDKQEKLEAGDKYGRYCSGDGFQCRELKFPNIVDLDIWAHINHITWFEETDYEEAED